MKKQWFVVFYFFIFALISGAIYSQLITILGISTMEMFSIDAGQVASLYLMISLLSFIITLFFGYLSDLYGCRWLLVFISLICGSSATYFSGSLDSYSAFLLVFIPLFSLVYLATPQLMAIYRTLLDSMSGVGNIALCNAIVRCGFALAWIVGPPVGYYLKDRIGPESLFTIFSALYGVAAIYSLAGAFLFGDVSGSSLGFNQ